MKVSGMWVVAAAILAPAPADAARLAQAASIKMVPAAALHTP